MERITTQSTGYQSSSRPGFIRLNGGGGTYSSDTLRLAHWAQSRVPSGIVDWYTARHTVPQTITTEYYIIDNNREHNINTEINNELCNEGLNILEDANQEGYNEDKYVKLCNIFKKLYSLK
jgi:hypothetical protein